MFSKFVSCEFLFNSIDWQTPVGQNVIGILEISIMEIENREI